MLDFCGGLYFTADGLAEASLHAAKGQLQTPEGRPYSELALWRELHDTTLVVLDEVAARERVSDWHYSRVKRLLDEREGRPLIVLSNMGLAQVARLYDDRLASRLAGGEFLVLEGRDRRLPAPPSGGES